MLKVTPHVTNNRQVLMQIEAERSNIRTLAAADLGFTIQKQNAKNQLLVNDGETAVIGGLTVTEVTKTRSGLPLLVDLPIVGQALRLQQHPGTAAGSHHPGHAAHHRRRRRVGRHRQSHAGASPTAGRARVFGRAPLAASEAQLLSGPSTRYLGPMSLRFLTAGESHGKALVALVEGLPAGLPVTAEWVDADLARRMMGYGRGARMKIERDRIEWLSGVRAGETLGSPVAMVIQNRDWTNWSEIMAAEGTPGDARRRRLNRPRPGHADLVGVLKYDRHDARDILERASARETAARVAAGALARRLLDEFQIDVGSHVVSLGGIRAVAAAESATTAQRCLRSLGGPGARSRRRGRDHRPYRQGQEGRRHPRRRMRSGGARPARPGSGATSTGIGSSTGAWLER